ncbi:hypothetical protein IWX90DRAFT_22236 [Phyllosticta citrichinensis]|uniref:Uncharacterized protein n=1 Tax=Phyllosticta citrichinensis TaxID=1130410 RepID=A0ABR1Y7F7_9PEZI
MAAKSIFDDLSLLHATAQKDPGWQFVHDEQALIHSIINVTSTSSPSFQAVALNGQATREMWDKQRASSSNAWARRAIGWDAKFKLTGIFLDTACSEASGNSAGAWNASSRDNGTIFLDIGPSDSLNNEFSGASCSISVKQVLFVIQQWIVENDFDAQRPDYSPNGYDSTPFSQVDDVPSSATNVGIANELADWFNAVIPSLQSLFPNPQTANLTSIAMRLSNTVAELGHGHTPMDGLAMVVAFMFANILTTFDWTFEEVPGMTTRQGPVRWQIYGSGPRLQWQWVIAIVIGVNIVVQLYDIFLILWHRNAKGLWLSLGGMLFAANAAAPMAVVKLDQGAGFIPDSKKDARFFMRQTKDSEGDEMRAVMISDRDEDRLKVYEVLDSKKSYGKVDPVEDDSK